MIPSASALKQRIEAEQRQRANEKARCEARITAQAQAEAERVLAAAIVQMEKRLLLRVSIDGTIDHNTETALKTLCAGKGYTWHRGWEEFGYIGGDISIQ